jgi:hypothetical protein
MELKTTKHLERPRNTSVQQPLLYETSYEANCHDDSSGVKFDLMIEIRSKSSNISIKQTPDVFGGDRQEGEARSICANENSLTVMYKELSLRRPVSELSNANISRCGVQRISGGKTQNIRISTDDRGGCMDSYSECTGNNKRRASHIKTDEFRPTIHPLDSNLPMPPPSPLEL